MTVKKIGPPQSFRRAWDLLDGLLAPNPRGEPRGTGAFVALAHYSTHSAILGPFASVECARRRVSEDPDVESFTVAEVMNPGPHREGRR